MVGIRLAANTLLLGLALLPGARAAGGESTPAPVSHPSAQQLTHDLLSLAARYQRASGGQRMRLGQALRRVAASRQRLLAALIKSEPATVAGVALPAAMRASLPRGARRFVEEEVEMEGALDVLVEDFPDVAVLHHSLRTADDQCLPVRFAGAPPPLESGSLVRVRGVRLGNRLVLEPAVENPRAPAAGSSTFVSESLAISSGTFGEQRVAVILVNFQDNAVQPYTPRAAYDMVFGSVSSFEMEASYQQTWLTGDVFGWYTIPVSTTTCNLTSIASYAKAAAQSAGVDLSSYRRFVYAFPDNACTAVGQSTVGGNPSQVWVKGTLQFSVVAHELGHSLGLYHAHGLECGTTTLGSSCSVKEYGDTVDMMGTAPNHFNPFQKERLGWLASGASPPITLVQATGSYPLDLYETTAAGPKALKILKSVDATTGAKTWYYVEYRQAIGYDGTMWNKPNILVGVVVHVATEGQGNTSYLLDMTPQTDSWWDPALDVGQSFSDPAAGMTISTVSATATGAVVSVTLAAQPCVRASPSFTISPAQSQWVAAGTPVTFTATVVNNDSAACAASAFGLQAVVPAGWASGFASSSLTVSPGATGSTALQVVSAAGATSGFYSISLSAMNALSSSLSTSATATYVVGSSIGLTASTDHATYSSGQSVTVMAVATAAGAALAGASVNFVVTRPNRSTIAATATTATDGSALMKLRLRRGDPTGVYQVTVSATSGGMSAAAATSFTVQ